MSEYRFPILVTIIISCLLTQWSSIYAQNNNKGTGHISLQVKNMPMHDVLSLIEHQCQYKFAYNTTLIAKQKEVTFDVKNAFLTELLQLLFKDGYISYTIIDNQIVLLEALKPKKITISGYIKDSLSGESLPGVIVFLPSTKAGTLSNSYGFYSMTIDEYDNLDLIVSFLGYKRNYQKVNAHRNLIMNFNLSKKEILLNPIIINADSPNDNVRRSQLGKMEIPIEMIKTPTAIIGNGDILNSIQMLPGVMAGFDGKAGYFVRGGNADQNLIQLDEATLYNPNHLFGLVSIINTSVIKSTTLLKGGFPVSFGDNLSSVLDITMNDGNNKQNGGNIQLGTIVGGVTLFGPIVSQKASYLISARRSTLDLIFKPMNIKNYYSDYYFYDVNAKLNFQLSQKDHFFLSIYQGRDNSSYSRDTLDKGAINYGVNFGNQSLTLRWNHLYSQKLFSNTSLVYSDYFQSLTASQQQYYAQLYSGIKNINIKSDLNYYPNPNHKISVGFNYLFQTLAPASVSDQAISTSSIITIDPSAIPVKNTYRLAGYFSDDIKISSKFSAYLGARIPFFYKYNVQYLNIEPRLAFLYMLNPTTSIKLAYSVMHQYVHLVQSYNSSFPAEIWIGSSNLVKPESSQQISAGIFKNFNDNMFQTSLEVYYKEMGNQILFRGGEQPSLTTDIEQMLIFGKSQSYGTELFIRKLTGKLTGWLAYTNSYASQQFDSLNLGKSFPFANDRRHSFNVSAVYEINKHWKISSNFILASGRAFTLDESILPVTTDSNPLFNHRKPAKAAGKDKGSNNGTGSTTVKSAPEILQNNYRLAPYNRLDFSIRYNSRKKLRHRILETDWVFSVYNVYARPNTFFAYRSIDPVTKIPIARQVSFYPIIPSISYNLTF